MLTYRYMRRKRGVNRVNMLTKEILDQSDIIAYIDRDGVYRYVNSLWQKKTGIAYADVVGRSTNDILQGSGALSAMKTGRKVSGIMYYTLTSGRKFSAAVKYRPVKDESGKICGCTVESIFDDITEALSFAGKLKKHRGKEERLKSGKTTGSARYSIDDIIGVSSATEKLKEQIYIAAGTDATVLLEGETGTGKELVAHAIHELSARSSFPFVRVNCSAIPENLMESEFFGYEEGSFTGGVKGGRTGKFEAADHGSLFLDEINAMEITMQPKLLRALQEKEIEKIGGSVSIPVDDRIIAASNQPLERLVEKGAFRQDLYYRLNIIHIIIPPLRERTDDIPVLAEHFMKRYNSELNRSVTGITQAASRYLKTREWPGNIRELQNNIERAMISCIGNTLDLKDFERFGRAHAAEQSFTGNEKHLSEQAVTMPGYRPETEITGLFSTEDSSLSQVRADTERTMIIRVLRECENNKTKTAQKLGISRTLLYRKLKQYEIR